MNPVTATTSNIAQAQGYKFDGFLLQIKTKCWSGEKQAKAKDFLKEGTNPEFIRGVKKLVDPDSLKDIRSVQSAVRNAIYKYTLPFPLDNVYFVPTKYRDKVYAIIAEHQEKLAEHVKTLCAKYQHLISQAQVALGNAFNLRDYPSEEALADRFRIYAMPEFQLAPADTSPKGNEAMQAILQEFVTDAKNVLLDQMAALIERVTSNLTVKYKEDGSKGKQRITDSMVDDIYHFTDLVQTLNVGNDNQLHELATKLRDIVTENNLSVAKLRNSQMYRDRIRMAFEELGKVALTPNQGTELVESDEDSGIVGTGRRIRRRAN